MNTAAKSDNETVLLAEYFCELALLQSELGDFPVAEVAASCVLFSRLVQKLGMQQCDMQNGTLCRVRI